MRTLTMTNDANHADIESLRGFNIWETAAATAVVELRVASVTGTVIKRIQLKSDQMVLIALGKDYWEFPGGCYVKLVSGTVSGTLDY